MARGLGVVGRLLDAAYLQRPPLQWFVKQCASDNVTWRALRARLQAEADPVVAERYKQIAPTGGSVLGIKVPVLRAIAREYAGKEKGLGASDAVGMADAAFASGCREEMLLATFLVARFKTKFEASHWGKIDRWIDRIDNWESCDQLATGVAGEMIGRTTAAQKQIWVRDLGRWTQSPNPWRRRFAVATTTALNQKGRSDCQTCLRICERLICDSDRNVRKAVAWALREACKSDPGAVFAFLESNRGRMPRTVLRESAAKLTPAQRASLGVR